MTRGYSIYLDAIRFIASVLVLFSHIAYPRYSNGDLVWMRDLNLGSDAVILFFVLSGFVIAHTTHAKQRTGAGYAAARAARLYSVVIPALLVTLACDLIGRSINPGAYDGWWYNGSGIPEQLLRALTFSSQAGGDTMRIGTNGPFWSVAYEAWYYAAFGIAVFARGWVRIAALGLLAWLAGVSIALLAPCWLAGVGLHHLTTRMDISAVRPAFAWVLALAPWAIYAHWLSIGLPKTLTAYTFVMFGAQQTPNAMFGFADEFIWNNLLALLFAAHFFGVYCLAGQAQRIGPRIEAVVRWMAGATFSIYLFHYPLITLLYAMPGYDAGNQMHYFGIAAIALVLCFILAEFSERRLGAWKAGIDKAMDHARALQRRRPLTKVV